MRNPEKVLDALCPHSKVSDYKYERLHRVLFNEDMSYVVYQHVYTKRDSMISGADGKTIDQMSIQRIERIIESLKNGIYQPKPVKRVYIPKKNGGNRPLGIPSFEDKSVQGATRTMLEVIYKGYLEDTPYSFRLYKSCHTALTHIQHQLTGARWFTKGNIKGFFDNINHNILIDTLREQISDERFLRLVRKFPNAGYVDNWKYNRTYSGTPRGRIISPILTNIYLDEFDRYIDEHTERFNKSEEEGRNATYLQKSTQAVSLRKKLKIRTDPCVKAEPTEKTKKLQVEIRDIPRSHDTDENYRGMEYARYADDFIIGVIGSKADCEKIKADITRYMNGVFNLGLSAKRTLITHARDTVKFPGYELSVRKSCAMKRNRKGVFQRDFNDRVAFTLPMEAVEKKLRECGAISFEQANGKEIWKPRSRSRLTTTQPHDVLAQFNQEIRGSYSCCSIVNNVSATCSKLGYTMEYSMCLILAQKLRSTIGKLKKKCETNKQFIIPYRDDKGRRQYRILYDDRFKRRTTDANTNCDTQPFIVIVPPPTSVERFKINRCELCGVESLTVIHRVCALKTLSKEYEWSRTMLNRNRETLAVCPSCNAKIQEHEK